MVIPFLKVKVRNTIPFLFRNGNRTANGVPLFLRTVTMVYRSLKERQGTLYHSVKRTVKARPKNIYETVKEQ